jgi:AcrR family transcriptional regulator
VARPGKRAQRRETSTAKIIDAAERLFVERGYVETTMQDVVREAGTSIGNLYFYFENKDDLLQAVVERSVIEGHRLGDELAAKVAPGPARLAVVVFASASFRLSPGSRPLAILTQTSGYVVAEQVATRSAERIRRYLAENLPDLDPGSMDYASRIWAAAGRGAIEAHVRFATMSFVDLAAYLTRWDLRGVGVPEDQIDEAIAVARRIVPGMTGDHDDSQSL